MGLFTLRRDTDSYAQQLAIFMSYAEDSLSEIHQYFCKLGVAKASTVEVLGERLRRARCPLSRPLFLSGSTVLLPVLPISTGGDSLLTNELLANVQQDISTNAGVTKSANA